MSPAEVKSARQQLGFTQSQLADALRLDSPYGKDVVRSWEAGRRPISGPAQVAIELMLAMNKSDTSDITKDNADVRENRTTANSLEKQ